MDAARSGSIKMRGFQAGLEACDMHLDRSQYAALFKAVDADGNRSVSMDELVA